ncbi:hypothetical protein ASF09_15280 [Sphingomonas sp. Leaf242]|nr:hypothetical protein ASF09_15280 [Sphingomonas sp. Leaf242]
MPGNLGKSWSPLREELQRTVRTVVQQRDDRDPAAEPLGCAIDCSEAGGQMLLFVFNRDSDRDTTLSRN